MKDLAERALKTGVQTFLALVAASGLDIAGAINDTSTLQRATVAAAGAVLSVLTTALQKWASS